MELKKVGFTADQADTSIKVLIDVMNDNFATKHDIQDVKSEIALTKAEIAFTKAELTSKIEALEYKLTIKLGAITTVAIGVTATLLKLIQSSR